MVTLEKLSILCSFSVNKPLLPTHIFTEAALKQISQLNENDDVTSVWSHIFSTEDSWSKRYNMFTIVHWHYWYCVPIETKTEHKISAQVLRLWTISVPVLWCCASKHMAVIKWMVLHFQTTPLKLYRRQRERQNTCYLLCLLRFNLLVLCFIGWWMFSILTSGIPATYHHTVGMWLQNPSGQIPTGNGD